MDSKVGSEAWRGKSSSFSLVDAKRSHLYSASREVRAMTGLFHKHPDPECLAFLERAFGGGLARSLFDGLREKFARPDGEIEPEYSVSFRAGGTGWGHKTSDVCDHTYWDLPFGIQLILGRYVLAGIGFEPMSDILRVRQIQGVPGQASFLRPLRWQLALVELLGELAVRSSPYAELQVIRAKDQPFYEDGGGDEERRLRERMNSHYDGTARGLGFRWCDSRGAYYKLLRSG